MLWCAVFAHSTVLKVRADLPLQSEHCPARGLDDESFWGRFVKSEKQVVGAGMKEISFQKPALSSLAFVNS